MSATVYSDLRQPDAEFKSLIQRAQLGATDEERKALILAAHERARKEHYDAEPDPRNDPLADLRNANVDDPKTLPLPQQPNIGPFVAQDTEYSFM